MAKATGKVSVIVPCYNEEETIGGIIQELRDLGETLDIEVILVDDGSTDETFEKLTTMTGVVVVRHEKNRGKGAAIMTGAAKSSGDVIVIQDADLEYDPRDIPELVNPILAGKFDVVYGSRFKGKIAGMTFSHYFGNKVLSLLTRMMFGAAVTDVMTGHKAFKADVFRSLDLSSERFGFEIEVTVRTLAKGYSIYEVSTTWSKREFGHSKIGWVDGVKCAIQLFKYRLEI